MNDAVCTRVEWSPFGVRRSCAGVSLQGSNGFVHTYLFGNDDLNIALPVYGYGDEVHGLRMFHVFTGNFIRQFESCPYEVFRFHGETWKVDRWDPDSGTPDVIGTEVHRLNRPDETLIHSYEHLGGYFLTDFYHLSARLQAARNFDRPVLRFTPDPDEYKKVMPSPSHPEVFIVEHLVDMIEIDLRQRSQAKQYLM